MRNIHIAVLLLAACVPCKAEMTAAARNARVVSDSAMVIKDRGSVLEVMPDKRATAAASATGRAKGERAIVPAKPTSPMSVNQLGVVFNYSMQVQGYITGEVAFKLKNSDWGDAVAAKSLPGFKKLTDSNVFVAVARTPLEFVEMVGQLQRYSAIEWVEPVVFY